MKCDSIIFLNFVLKTGRGYKLDGLDIHFVVVFWILNIQIKSYCSGGSKSYLGDIVVCVRSVLEYKHYVIMNYTVSIQ